MSAQKNYRQSEINRIIEKFLLSDAQKPDFKIQIDSDNGSTRWLNISAAELLAIRNLLIED